MAMAGPPGKLLDGINWVVGLEPEGAISIGSNPISSRAGPATEEAAEPLRRVTQGRHARAREASQSRTRQAAARENQSRPRTDSRTPSRSITGWWLLGREAILDPLIAGSRPRPLVYARRRLRAADSGSVQRLRRAPSSRDQGYPRARQTPRPRAARQGPALRALGFRIAATARTLREYPGDDRSRVGPPGFVHT
jgi:hypothetical protein